MLFVVIPSETEGMLDLSVVEHIYPKHVGREIEMDRGWIRKRGSCKNLPLLVFFSLKNGL